MTDPADLLDVTAQIVSAYVGRNEVEPDELPDLIKSVYETVTDLSAETAERRAGPKPIPAIPVGESVTDDFIYSLEDGQPYKSLKRHLKAKYNMTPEAYREKWDLPQDYPMVAPSYARERSELAKKSGLGRQRPGNY